MLIWLVDLMMLVITTLIHTFTMTYGDWTYPICNGYCYPANYPKQFIFIVPWSTMDKLSLLAESMKRHETLMIQKACRMKNESIQCKHVMSRSVLWSKFAGMPSIIIAKIWSNRLMIHSWRREFPSKEFKNSKPKNATKWNSFTQPLINTQLSFQ